MSSPNWQEPPRLYLVAARSAVVANVQPREWAEVVHELETHPKITLFAVLPGQGLTVGGSSPESRDWNPEGVAIVGMSTLMVEELRDLPQLIVEEYSPALQERFPLPASMSWILSASLG